MTQSVRQNAANDLKMLEEVTAVHLAEPSTALVPLAEADKPSKVICLIAGKT